jgi:hypothetical protein
MESVWTALRTDWWDRGACVVGKANADEFSPVVESEAGLERVSQRWCNHCPVRSQCLNSALVNNDSGYRGGTHTAQRKALRRTRSRVKCPLCKGANLVYTEEHEVCVNCGASWKIDKKPEPPAEAVAELVAAPEPSRGHPVPGRLSPTAKVKNVPLTEEASACL